jgi:hypothetical protein
MRTSLILVFVLTFLTNSGRARADWLDDVWSKSTAQQGNPAITVRPDGVVVVLPAETFRRAFLESRMTPPDVVRAFLDRYSPQCSHVLNLNVAQPNLAVELRIQVATSLDGVSVETQDEMLSAMETVRISPPEGAEPKGATANGHAAIPRIAQAFTILPGRSTLSIDYVPEKTVHCVVPEDPQS